MARQVGRESTPENSKRDMNGNRIDNKPVEAIIPARKVKLINRQQTLGPISEQCPETSTTGLIKQQPIMGIRQCRLRSSPFQCCPHRLRASQTHHRLIPGLQTELKKTSRRHQRLARSINHHRYLVEQEFKIGTLQTRATLTTIIKGGTRHHRRKCITMLA